ncbi:MAG: hypothetical protein HKO90_08430 [Flavobacteriaceae bacterium]|nr:hypothetical protein [Flavobacteriaceae bacterium]
MQFKNPEILYALFLLLIPIIVHLFQLRRFQKVPFTNVEFLRNVNKQTRKSRQLKKWLTLATRLLLLTCIILAFAQPFSGATDQLVSDSETVIYLDNSFSMQAKGERGELLKRAVQDLIENSTDDSRFHLFTNTNEFRDVSLKSIQNELLQLNYTGKQLDYNAVLLKANQLFDRDDSGMKNFVMISDFQQRHNLSLNVIDSTINASFVQLRPVSQNNFSLDSAYIGNRNLNTMELKVKLKGDPSELENIPISLHNNNTLMAKTVVDNNGGDPEATFSLPVNETIKGELSIEDAQLQYDNKLYFSIDEREKTKVLSINMADDNFLRRVFTDAEFEFSAVAFDQLNYNTIDDQNLIIINELESLPTALVNALSAFINNKGYILIIPSDDIELNSYNQLLNRISNISFEDLLKEEKRITRINYSHPLFRDVFDKEVTNFQYPKANTSIRANSPISPVLQFEDGSPFFIQTGNVFVFTAALNTENSNMINSPLIVPTLYNVGRQSFKTPGLYYIVGDDSSFDVNTTLPPDNILRLRKDALEVIPQQQTFPKKVNVQIKDNPTEAGTFEVLNSNEVIEHLSLNHDRRESDLLYFNLAEQFDIDTFNSIQGVLETIKSSTEINDLWKWFVIFALIFLIAEMLILKFIR